MPSNPKLIKSRLFSTNHRLLLEKKIRKELPLCQGKTLVLGAGHDPYRSYLANANEILTNDIDSDLKSIDIISTAENLPISSNNIDSIVAIEVFEHVTDISLCISECLRILKPNGILYITMPFMFHIHGDPNDYRRLTIPGLRNLLGNEFKILHSSYFGNIIHVIFDSLSSSCLPMKLLRPFFLVASLISFTSNKFPSGVTIIAAKK
jgi:SAM-dependent methyltransferase